jgi:hypothetical protein
MPRDNFQMSNNLAEDGLVQAGVLHSIAWSSLTSLKIEFTGGFRLLTGRPADGG